MNQTSGLGMHLVVREEEKLFVDHLAQDLRAQVVEQSRELPARPAAIFGRRQQILGSNSHLLQQQVVLIGEREPMNARTSRSWRSVTLSRCHPAHQPAHRSITATEW